MSVKRVEIKTVCLATVTELWTYDVPGDWTDDQIREAFVDYDGLDPDFRYVGVTERVDDEQDRDILSVEEVLHHV